MGTIVNNKWIKKIVWGMMTAAAAAVLLAAPVQAAGTVSVTADKASVQIGDTVTFSFQTSDPEDDAVAPQIRVTYDPQLLEYVSCDTECGGGGGLLTLSSTAAGIQFKALAQGTANVAVEAVLDDDGNNPASGSAGVSVGAAGGMSSDATLRALVVEPGTLSPEFSPSVTEYTITVENQVTDITVSGGVTDENAQITAASGFKNLKKGTNQAVITVTAQDGSTLTYHFTITRTEDASEEPAQQEPEETPQEDNAADAAPTQGAGLTFQMDGVTYQVSQGYDSSLLPQDCVKQDVAFQGQEVEGACFEAGALQLVYAISGADGTGDFYICDAKSGIVSLFIQLKTGNTDYIVPIQSPDDAPAGFHEEAMHWNNAYIPAYQVTDASLAGAKDFYLLYGVNQSGDYGYYLYDVLQGTCQRFLGYGAAAGSTGVKAGSRVTIIIGMMAVVMVGLLMLIVNLILRNKELTADMEDLAKERKGAKKAPLESAKQTEKKVEKRAEKRAEKKAEKKKEMKEPERAPKEEPQEEMHIEITAAADAAKKQTYSRSEQEEAQEQALRSAEQKAARKAALEREIAKDEKARAKREAAEMKKQQEAQRQAERQALARQKALEKQEAAEKLRQQKALEKQEAAEKLRQQKAQEEENARKDRQPAVKREVTERGVTYTTGRIPITVVTPEKPAVKRNPVPIFTLERRPVSLTRESAPDEMDEDFEFEFINIHKD